MASGESTVVGDRNRQTTPLGDGTSGPLSIEPEAGGRVAWNFVKCFGESNLRLQKSNFNHRGNSATTGRFEA